MLSARVRTMKHSLAASIMLAAAIIAQSPTRAASLPLAGAEAPAMASPAEPPTPRGLEPSLAVLRALLQQEVPHLLTLPASHKRRLLDLAWNLLQPFPDSGLDRPQILLVVDRNPAVQELLVVAAFPGKPWEVIGATHV